MFTMAMVLLMVLAFGASAFAAGGSLTAEEAKQAALDYAGVDASEATFTKTHKDWDDGLEIYEIEFYAGDTEYELDVDANTGKIVEFSTEYYGGRNRQRRAFSAGENPTMDQAKQAALEYVGVDPSEASFTKTGKDRDDGREVYEIEFYVDATEYEFDVDVNSGKIVFFKAEYYGDRDAMPEVFDADKNPTMEEIKQAALDYAEADPTEATFTKSKKDRDDGREVYELEFYANDTEYEMDVEANTGKLVSFSMEYHGR